MKLAGGPGAVRHMMDDEDRARILALFRGGMSKREITQMTGCTEGGVYHVLIKFGLHKPKPAKYRRSSPRAMAALYRLGG